jgi:hypothetical protein
MKHLLARRGAGRGSAAPSLSTDRPTSVCHRCPSQRNKQVPRRRLCAPALDRPPRAGGPAAAAARRAGGAAGEPAAGGRRPEADEGAGFSGRNHRPAASAVPSPSPSASTPSSRVADLTPPPTPTNPHHQPLPQADPIELTIVCWSLAKLQVLRQGKTPTRRAAALAADPDPDPAAVLDRVWLTLADVVVARVKELAPEQVASALWAFSVTGTEPARKVLMVSEPGGGGAAGRKGAAAVVGRLRRGRLCRLHK